MVYQLTRAQFEAKRTELAALGHTMVGDNGTLSDDGVEVSFNYVEPNCDVEILKKPFELTEHFVQGKIDNWFKI